MFMIDITFSLRELTGGILVAVCFLTRGVCDYQFIDQYIDQYWLGDYR